MIEAPGVAEISLYKKVAEKLNILGGAKRKPCLRHKISSAVWLNDFMFA